MCTDAYRAALTRDFRRGADPGQAGLAPRGVAAPAGATAGSGAASTPAKNAGLVNGEAADHR